MNGYRTLLNLRMAGYKPAAVFVTVLDSPAPRGFWLNAENAIANGGFPQLDIEPADDVHNLDLRALRGVTVHLGGRDYSRVLDVLEQIIEFEPGEVIFVRAKGFPAILDWTPDHGLRELEVE